MRPLNVIESPSNTTIYANVLELVETSNTGILSDSTDYGSSDDLLTLPANVGGTTEIVTLPGNA